MEVLQLLAAQLVSPVPQAEGQFCLEVRGAAEVQQGRTAELVGVLRAAEVVLAEVPEEALTEQQGGHSAVQEAIEGEEAQEVQGTMVHFLVCHALALCVAEQVEEGVSSSHWQLRRKLGPPALSGQTL